MNYGIDSLKKLSEKIYPILQANGTLTGFSMVACSAFCKSKYSSGLSKDLFCIFSGGASAALLGTCGYTAAKAAYIVLKPYAISYGKKVMTTLF